VDVGERWWEGGDWGEVMEKMEEEMGEITEEIGEGARMEGVSGEGATREVGGRLGKGVIDDDDVGRDTRGLVFGDTVGVVGRE